MRDLATFEEYVDRYIEDRPDNTARDWMAEYIGYVDASIAQDRQEKEPPAAYDGWEWDR